MSGRWLVAFLAGAAAVAAAGFAFLEYPPWVAAIPLVVAGALLGRAPGAVLTGGAISACSFAAVLGRVDPRLGVAGAALVLGCAAWIVLSERSPQPPARTGRSLLPAGLVAAGLCGLCLRVVDANRLLAGPDLPGLGAVLGGVLAAAGVGAATARFLGRRHAREAPLLLLAVGVLAVVALLRLPYDAAPWLERARALHAPDVSRAQFLAGCGLLALLVAGGAGLGIGAVLGALAQRVGSQRRVAAALACGVAVFLWAPATLMAFPAVCIAVAVACSVRPAALAALGLAAAIGIGVIEGMREPPRPIDREAIGADQVYVDLGDVELAAAFGSRGAEPAPAWPLTDGLLGILRFVDVAAAAGPVAIAPEFSPWSNRVEPRQERTWTLRGERPGQESTLGPVAAWVAPVIPSYATRASTAPPPRLRPGAIVVEPLDLWRVTADELDAWLDASRHAAVFVFGRFLVRVTGSPAVAQLARGPFLAFAPVLGADAVEGRDRSLRADARTRLVPDLPRTGARALEHVLARSNALRTNDVPTWMARARLELAIAILRDDALAETRLLRLLEATDPAAIAALRHQRAAARERLWLRLALLRAADSTDADVRFRFGTLLGRGTRPLVGVEELTRCIEFRPTLVEAFEELARAYLAAADRNEFKWTATGPLDISYAVERLVVLMHPERVDVLPQARMWTLLGRARRAKAQRQDVASARTPLLNDALGRFHRALELVVDDPEALLFHAATLRELGEVDGAARFAKRAVDVAPLDCRARALLAASQRDTDVGVARAELRAAFRLGFGFPTPRTR